MIRQIVIAVLLLGLGGLAAWGTYRLYLLNAEPGVRVHPDPAKAVARHSTTAGEEGEEIIIQPGTEAPPPPGQPTQPPPPAPPVRPVQPPKPPPLAYVADGTVGGDKVFDRNLAGIAIDRPGKLLYAAGDGVVKVFKLADGKLLETIRPSSNRQPTCIGLDPAGNFYIGAGGRVEKYRRGGNGQRLAKIADRKVGEVTSVEGVGQEVLIGDATAGRIRRFRPDDTETGGLPPSRLDLVPASQPAAGPLGERQPPPSLVLPNKTLDFAVTPDGRVVLAHPGPHQVELYGPAGKLLWKKGRFGQRDPADFVGCCNPINVAAFPLAALNRPELTGLGIVTAEKSLARVKVYDEQFRLLAVIDKDHFDQSNVTMDLAVDAQGRIYVADTNRRAIRRFAPR